MELKEYQQKSLAQVKRYLASLSTWRAKNEQVVSIAGPEAAIDCPSKAWEQIVGTTYQTRKNGLGDYLPNFCLKIPTGGGKTLLAVKTIDLIQTAYLHTQTGLVLWVVPTTQIYRQTIENLRDHDHPYRQHLDIASGGRTLILEKSDRFTPLDVSQNLVVVMLMLQSSSRQNKETLRMFKDSGGFVEFFPPEDDAEGHARLLERFPNLNTFASGSGFFPRQVMTSLGNTLRIVSPIIILDEGHKAYSQTAQGTLRGFNPSIIVELSATPLDKSNVLVDIKGVELDREEMIKLDLHIINKASIDWKDTLLSSIEKRNLLEHKTTDYEATTGEYIRPICLIQVERTGKEQRGRNFIHSEDVKDRLVKVHGIPEEQVAIKTSDRDDIEGIDLLSRGCPVRYIITKQALQEGWDCAFAYVLTILTKPTSKNNLTQLVGRILRQPFARKTGVKDLDESYVVCFQQGTVQLLTDIRTGFAQEGLGDLAGRIVPDETPEEGITPEHERTVGLRDKFQHFAGTIYLPVFAVRNGNGWRPINYDMDIASKINWKEMDCSPLETLVLSVTEEKDVEVAVGLDEDESVLLKQKGVTRLKEGGLALDYVFAVRHLIDIMPNPWTGYEVCSRLFKHLQSKHGAKMVANNLVSILEELRKRAEKEKERLAEKVFRAMVKSGQLRFLLLRSERGYRLPSQLAVSRTSRTLTHADGQPLQRSLFDFVPEEEFNSLEKTVAWYLEEQEKLLWWYRNLSRQDYAVQGWRKNKIYPDFVFSHMNDEDENDYDKVFVVETKGVYLKNEDTDYKKRVFSLCNELGEEKSWTELKLEFPEKKVVFEVIFEDEWRRRILALFADYSS